MCTFADRGVSDCLLMLRTQSGSTHTSPCLVHSEVEGPFDPVAAEFVFLGHTAFVESLVVDKYSPGQGFTPDTFGDTLTSSWFLYARC